MSIKTRKVDTILYGEDKEIVFEKKNFEVPEDWSDQAALIVASKYATEDEYSAIQIIDRIVNYIAEGGIKHNYFSAEEKEPFKESLRQLLIEQKCAFNSPIWMNIGVEGVSQQSAACFLGTVEDTMDDILSHMHRAGMIFKSGSGIGVNISKLRAANESLSNKGKSSGPLSFARAWDKSAASIKSGGRCLAPNQKVLTNLGPISVKDLAESNKEFFVLSFDPPANRFKFKKATAWKQEVLKKIVKITTDKGVFYLSEDHPVKINGFLDYRKAGELTPGMSLFQCSLDLYLGGYIRVHLRNGKKGKDLLHRMLLKDIMGVSNDLVIHHIDGNSLNNDITNLEAITQSEHAKLRADKLVSREEHVFQKKKFSKAGLNNPMHKDSDFWKDSKKSSNFREKQRHILKSSERSRNMQLLATKQRMKNSAYMVLNSGYCIDTFESYCEGIKKLKNYNPPKKSLIGAILRNFDSYENFVKEIRRDNHEVLSIEEVSESEVYSVEVQCPTLDDKSINSGHNFVIWPDENNSSTGSGIVVSNTRRSATLLGMEADHPDIEEFIECKSKEEKKIKDLLGLGYSLDEANWSADFQNANHSVILTDEFMKKVKTNKKWDLVNRTDGKVAKKIKVKELFEKIAQKAWETGDPGLQFSDTINAANPIPNEGIIETSNPCGEIYGVNWTTCLLAAFNLVKYIQRIDKQQYIFDTITLERDIETIVVAMDILIEISDYPHENFERVAKSTRPLGVGVTNLGAALMISGLAYDSEEGREMARFIYQNITSFAANASIKLSQRVGPFKVFPRNVKETITAIANNCLPMDRKRLAKTIKLHGIRNSQLTTAMPAGTVSLVLDADTYGIEPLYSLKTIRTLVGGGKLEIIPKCVEIAKSEDYPDSVICTAESVHWKDHIRMLSALQEGISQGCSKTINMPIDATVEDVKEAYLMAWEEGVKGITIYRDGSKSWQPLEAAGKEKKKAEEQKPILERKRLPDDRESRTHHFDISGFEGYLTVGFYPGTKTPGEIFVRASKLGTSMQGMLDSFATMVSLALQYGIPLDKLAEKFIGTTYSPNGITHNPDIRFCSSVVDYIFNYLKANFMEDSSWKPTKECNNIVLTYDGPPCSFCGQTTHRQGTCYFCNSCGGSTGCG